MGTVLKQWPRAGPVLASQDGEVNLSVPGLSVESVIKLPRCGTVHQVWTSCCDHHQMGKPLYHDEGF